MSFAVGLGILIGAWLTVRHWNRLSPDQWSRQIRYALDHGRLPEARGLVEQAVKEFPHAAAIRLAAADVELESGQISAALEHLLQVPDDNSNQFLHARGSAGDLLFQLDRLSDAEQCFRRVLQSNPGNLGGQQRLALLLAVAGKRLAAQDLLFQIIRAGEFDTRDLALLAEPDQVFDNPELIKRYQGASLPPDPLALLGAARFAAHKNQHSLAADRFRQVLKDAPSDLDAMAGLGQALLDTGDVPAFLQWHARLPAQAHENSLIWQLRGRFALERGETETAIRCLGEAVSRDPNQIASNTQLGALLNQSGDSQRARRLQARAGQLRELREVLDIVLADSRRTDYLVRAGELTEALGRIWEARGWYLAAASQAQAPALRIRAEKLTPVLAADAPLTEPAANPVSGMDLSRFPLPNWKSAPGIESTTTAQSRTRQVRFVDRAHDAGVRFQYANGHDSQVQGYRIFESSGGGVAALDFDGDLWPDLYFTQGGDWPPVPGQTKHLDRLFHNLGTGQFADVTEQAGLGDDAYTQGVSSGDWNDDGFPDLYVANIGFNRLYRNNGDGTFSECTAVAGLANQSAWTTSVLVADVNSDGWPDLYDVTYVAGRLPFEHVCHDRVKKSLVRVCAPTVFEAEPDRLYLNRGDGTFTDVSRDAGVAIPDGKGLGVVAFDYTGSGRLSLYVANDTTPNFLLINDTAQAGDSPIFREQAKLLGCAVNVAGLAPASMGIAVDDANGDGLLDLFITAFYGEPYVLFLQLPGGLFVDATSSAGLKEPTVPMLGFGTQFLDGDLDGWPDLAMVNGHVDDLRDMGIPFHMRAQYFANTGDGRFVELLADQAGPFFAGEQLGRGMARLDWNRDGREDFAVSNLDTPASLATNQTADAGHSLCLHLRGVVSSRDAIGATVTVRIGERRLTRQLTAGDGYEASNQRILIFGLGQATRVDEVSIRWPQGFEQKLESLPADSEYLIIEGRRCLALPRPDVVP
ncbi:MAG: VCBS repeat-containing protein [Planctomycetes bacterium]|nr:VCBS repeat-containing protein [Planctomycetota bacterium]